MASVVFYFQVHQPYRLGRYNVFRNDPRYFDDAANEQIFKRVAEKCYRPTTDLLLDLVRRHEGRFKVSFSITGTVLEQCAAWAPDVLDRFGELVQTGACELLGETHYHSLSFLYDREEFLSQVNQHECAVRARFGVTPRVFRNTELIYNNDLAHYISGLTGPDGSPRYSGVLCEGVDRLLHGRSPSYVYRPPSVDTAARKGAPFGLLLKHYALSDDIAFRFSNRSWKGWPLRAETFAGWVNQINGDGHLCNLFMDYETFGEHQWSDTGVFGFLDALPEKVFDHSPGHNGFLTPSEAFTAHGSVGVYDAHDPISWADTERDLSAWLGNPMQSAAIAECFAVGADIKAALVASRARRDSEAEGRAAAALSDWRRVTTSDHFYYMCTKWFADGDVHKYFNPYDSPYDAYINAMNVLDHLRGRAAACGRVAGLQAAYA